MKNKDDENGQTDTKAENHGHKTDMKRSKRTKVINNGKIGYGRRTKWTS
jgi:hypothetical protein